MHGQGNRFPALLCSLAQYCRLDSPELLSALSSLCTNHLNDILNYFTLQAKRKSRKRVGGVVRRKHDKPRTPLAKLNECLGFTPR
ncbi:MAG: hypothetical protein IOD12_00990 [Silvanigrellales bacterium]|nr:hypothetical protein [Silvanigrellales bacterium]